MTTLEVVLILGATFRLAWLLAEEDFPPVKAIRDWILLRFPSDVAVYDYEDVDLDEHGRFQLAGRPMIQLDDRVSFVLADEDDAHWLGTLVRCPWCNSFWIGGILIALFLWQPLTQLLYLALTASAVSGLIAAWLEKE